jgi:hypothetical protein
MLSALQETAAAGRGFFRFRHGVNFPLPGNSTAASVGQPTLVIPSAARNLPYLLSGESRSLAFARDEESVKQFVEF